MVWCSPVIRVPDQGQLETKPHMHHTGDVMAQNAAKQESSVHLAATTTGFDQETITANNDVVCNSNDQSIDQLRSKIKAARLEKLMARQLESELSIEEIDFEPSLEALDLTPNEDVFSEAEAETEMQTPATKARGLFPRRSRVELTERSSEIDPRSRFKTQRQDCEKLLLEFQEHSRLMTRISDKSNSFLDYLNRIEQEFVAMDSMELEIREKTRELERIEKQRVEHRALVEKQSKQIELLETMRQSSANNYEETKRQLEELQAQTENQSNQLNEANALIARYEREALTANEKLDTMRSDFEKANASVNALRRQTQDQDRQLSHALSELNEVSAHNEQTLHELSSLQIKYNTLNKKALEQQGQHYSRISELEEALRRAKSQIEQSNREKSDLKHELEAANNLLVLHEDMIAALTPQNR